MISIFCSSSKLMSSSILGTKRGKSSKGSLLARAEAENTKHAAEIKRNYHRPIIPLYLRGN